MGSKKIGVSIVLALLLSGVQSVYAQEEQVEKDDTQSTDDQITNAPIELPELDQNADAEVASQLDEVMSEAEEPAQIEDAVQPPSIEATEDQPIDDVVDVATESEEAISEPEDNAQGEALVQTPVAEVAEDIVLGDEVEALKKAALQLNRDLLILEEELLFPANTQIAVFLSLDVGEYFRLDSVKVKIDDKVVASHLYTNRQNFALSEGGIQRLYVGNLKTGDHELTAIFTGMGPDNREYTRGATMTLNKDDDAKMIEVRVYDSQKNMQPEFDFKEWEL